MTYAIVVLLATIFTFLGFAIECTAGNITHVKNGREPNAGAAVVPNFPLIPMFVLGIAWLLDRWHANLGFWTVVLLFVLYLPFWWFTLRRMNDVLERAKKKTRLRAEGNHATSGALRSDRD